MHPSSDAVESAANASVSHTSMPSGSADWLVGDRLLELRNRWLTLIGEHWQTPTGQELEYWRVEKADSIIVIPCHNRQLLLPPPMFRPGVGHATLDFPGGRLPPGLSQEAAAMQILGRELGVGKGAIAHLRPINTTGWPINSSFSNQQLFGFVAQLQPACDPPPHPIGLRVPLTPAGRQTLLSQLHCLQCRALLLEWWIQSSTPADFEG